MRKSGIALQEIAHTELGRSRHDIGQRPQIDKVSQDFEIVPLVGLILRRFAFSVTVAAT